MKFKSEDINLLQLARNIKYMILLGQVTTEMTSHKTSIPQLSATIWAVLVLPNFFIQPELSVAVQLRLLYGFVGAYNFLIKV